MSIWGPLKPIEQTATDEGSPRLRPTLSWPHLIALGVGAIVGTGIYTLTGVGAERAGPAVIIAFLIAGSVCACAALAYAELATLIPTAGSAYTYSYTVLGELVAWVVGWSLILEYSLACSTVAVGWSGYLVGWLQASGITLPHALLNGPHGGGIVNLPAVLVSLTIAAMLIAGTRESATINIGLVIIKIAALAAFVAMAAPAFQTSNLVPFAPYGFTSHVVGGETRGIMAAAAIVFFAFYGFDAVATSAEEARNPGVAHAGTSARLLHCGGRGSRGFANSHPRHDVRPEPNLLRHGTRRIAAARTLQGLKAGQPGPGHRSDRSLRGGSRRFLPVG
jgi:APA family basic amino acid/polyamine antiporter